MMRKTAVVALLALVLLVTPQSVKAGGGAGCVACGLIVSLVEQVAMAKKTNIKAVADLLCDSVTSGNALLDPLCKMVLEGALGPIQADYDAGRDPHYTCLNTLKMCTDYPTCKLFQKWPPAPRPTRSETSPHRLFSDVRSKEELAASASEMMLWVTKMMGAEAAAELGKDPIPVVDHLPLVDNDKDSFSTIPRLRGSDWRGADCNDQKSDIYPGRRTSSYGPDVDYNCNGISGVDSFDNVPFKDKWCGASHPRGVTILGDSAAAHFIIPPAWLTPGTLDKDTFHNLVNVLENEADWPQCSWATGFVNLTSNPNDCPESLAPMKSIYQRMYERNRCNFRDYQNIAVNGARTSSMAPPNGIITTMKSRAGTDHPSTVFFALVGNDVCNGHPGMDHMTTVPEFRTNVKASLDYLDKHLAPNSSVIAVGLVDGRVLWDSMHDKIHPIGATYEEVYDYLICAETTPCWGWLNSNATARNETSARAAQLNQVYAEIATSGNNYQNFKFYYKDLDMKSVIAKWVQAGHQASDLIAKVDGFHPSQTGNALIASSIWEEMENSWPETIGPVNPHNNDIAKRFGDQGGYSA